MAALVGRLSCRTAFAKVFTSPSQRASRTCKLARTELLLQGSSNLETRILMNTQRVMAPEETGAQARIDESPTGSELLKQYGCGPLPIAGTQAAFYDRHLIFDGGREGQVSEKSLQNKAFSGVPAPGRGSFAIMIAWKPRQSSNREHSHRQELHQRYIFHPPGCQKGNAGSIGISKQHVGLFQER